ncbi:MAG: DUF481 domain-containing protein [Candidatus Acidiferrales bacterium]
MRPISKLIVVMAVTTVTLVLAGAALADTVVLKNGSKLVGTIVSSDGKDLTVKTDYAGDLKVQWSAVQELVSDEPLYVITKDQKTVSGAVTTEGSNLIVHTANAGTVSVAFADVTTIRSGAEQQAYENSLHPGIIEGWKGGLDVGFALARGNSETTNLNTAFTADRKTLHDEITLYASSLYSKNNAAGGGVTANAILGGAKYDRNLTGRLFAFASADYTHDQLQDLDLRSIYSAGLGWHVINTPTTTFDALAGLNYTRETYSAGLTTAGAVSGVSRNLPGITLGENLTHKFGSASLASEQFYFYPDLADLNQYRFALDAGWVTKINNWLGWQMSVSDRYVTNPPILGTKSNDLIFSTGLNISFSH